MISKRALKRYIDSTIKKRIAKLFYRDDVDEVDYFTTRIRGCYNLIKSLLAKTGKEKYSSKTLSELSSANTQLEMHGKNGAIGAVKGILRAKNIMNLVPGGKDVSTRLSVLAKGISNWFKGN